MEINQNKNELHLYPINNNKYMGAIDVKGATVSNSIQTVVILDSSGSMGNVTARFVKEILPLVMSKLNWNKGIDLINFSSKANWKYLTLSELKTSDIQSGGRTCIGPAIRMFRLCLESIQQNYPGQPIRVLTVCDGSISDPERAEEEMKKVVDFLATTEMMINSQALRLFTSKEQPDTRALSYLLQINNTVATNLCDIAATSSNETISSAIATLFQSDCFANYQTLQLEKPIILKYPWYADGKMRITLSPGWNIFWLKVVPTGTVKLGNVHVKVIVESQLSLSKFHQLIETKLAHIIDHVAILKVVGTAEANKAVDQIFAYFKMTEDALAIKSSTRNIKIISNLLVGIAKKNINNDSAQMVEFLRSTKRETEIQLRRKREAEEAEKLIQRKDEEERIKPEEEERLKREEKRKRQEEEARRKKEAEEQRLRRIEELVRIEEEAHEMKAGEEERRSREQEANKMKHGEEEHLRREEESRRRQRERNVREAEEERLKLEEEVRHKREEVERFKREEEERLKRKEEERLKREEFERLKREEEEERLQREDERKLQDEIRKKREEEYRVRREEEERDERFRLQQLRLELEEQKKLEAGLLFAQETDEKLQLHLQKKSSVDQPIDLQHINEKQKNDVADHAATGIFENITAMCNPAEPRKSRNSLITAAANKVRQFTGALRSGRNSNSNPNPIQTVFVLHENVFVAKKHCRFAEKIIPLVFSKISNGNSQLVHLLTVETDKTPAVQMLQSILQTLDANKPIRILVLTDMNSREQHKFDNFAETLIKFLNGSNFSFELQVLRIASECQEKSLRASNALRKYQLIDIDSKKSNVYIAAQIVELFHSDNFQKYEQEQLPMINRNSETKTQPTGVVSLDVDGKQSENVRNLNCESCRTNAQKHRRNYCIIYVVIFAIPIILLLFDIFIYFSKK
ncbi:uncharacterized protein LOC119081243 isoform X2 [Bradysia coprophila]|uniref:uncharacterized protein LOC119081243 isoform X2 n=1 Tax=Bradysia coprophila TaxID=38358 RepID=UPI00187D7B06|nr:uncharacterized protein LOC119081243 isoform X2 [Bradysia coprophila]